MSTITPSRNLDELTTEQPNDKTCDLALMRAYWHPRNPSQVVGHDAPVDVCNQPATHQVIITCCDNRVRYRCTAHADPFVGFSGTQVHGAICRNCLHRCLPGVCCHRIVMPL